MTSSFLDTAAWTSPDPTGFSHLKSGYPRNPPSPSYDEQPWSAPSQQGFCSPSGRQMPRSLDALRCAAERKAREFADLLNALEKANSGGPGIARPAASPSPFEPVAAGAAFSPSDTYPATYDSLFSSPVSMPDSPTASPPSGRVPDWRSPAPASPYNTSPSMTPPPAPATPPASWQQPPAPRSCFHGKRRRAPRGGSRSPQRFCLLVESAAAAWGPAWEARPASPPAGEGTGVFVPLRGAPRPAPSARGLAATSEHNGSSKSLHSVQSIVDALPDDLY